MTGTPGTTSTVRFTLTRANAIQWTNQPGARQGLRLDASTLTAAQLTAAENLMATALSSAGKAAQDEVRRADDVLAKIQNGYGSGLYSIAILGTPSTTTPWILQLTGNHLAYNIPFNGTHVSGTPMFLGTEPANWVVTASGSILVNGSISASTAGAQHAPLEGPAGCSAKPGAGRLQNNSAYATLALLSGSFTDVVAGPNGATDSNFGSLPYPTFGRGLEYRLLDAFTQGLVRALIASYVNTLPSDRANTVLGVYEGASQLGSTYVGFSRGASGTAEFGAFPSGTASQRSYIRVDGPARVDRVRGAERRGLFRPSALP